MSAILNQPFSTKTLDRVKIANINIEYNPALGQCWVEFWLVLGHLDADGNFVQHVHPETGQVAYKHLKIENGVNPFDNSALGVCDVCGKLHGRVSGECEVVECSGTVKAWDGWNRLAMTDDIMEKIRAVAYGFLLNEKALDPVTGGEVKLLDATLEE